MQAAVRRLIVVVALCAAALPCNAQPAPPAQAQPGIQARAAADRSIADAIIGAADRIAEAISGEIAETGDEMQGLVLRAIAILAAALAVTLLLGMIIGSLLSALILRGAIKRIVGQHQR